ncbi:unnamed protein product [Amoebophrya sp. A120]|nr:unnamed protein product [Amoebophrya sp. A120]CAD7976627.1 unnamed protein product [Amoebophrya sp. A120]|eukprot:GSA120T00014864001.1
MAAQHATVMCVGTMLNQRSEFVDFFFEVPENFTIGDMKRQFAQEFGAPVVSPANVSSSGGRDLLCGVRCSCTAWGHQQDRCIKSMFTLSCGEAACYSRYLN